MSIEYLDTDTTILLINEMQEQRPVSRYCCNRCSGEDMFISWYLVTINTLLFGGLIFIVVWFFVHN